MITVNPRSLERRMLLASFVIPAIATLDGARDTRFGKRFVRAPRD